MKVIGVVRTKSLEAGVALLGAASMGDRNVIEE